MWFGSVVLKGGTGTRGEALNRWTQRCGYLQPPRCEAFLVEGDMSEAVRDNAVNLSGSCCHLRRTLNGHAGPALTKLL